MVFILSCYFEQEQHPLERPKGVALRELQRVLTKFH
mgnify:CR=1 FL=1